MATVETRKRAVTQQLWKFGRTTGAGALSESIPITEPTLLHEIAIAVTPASGGLTTVENLTVVINSIGGAAYDYPLLTQAMAGVASGVHWQPTRPIHLDDGDSIDLAWSNTDVATYGITVMYQGA